MAWVPSFKLYQSNGSTLVYTFPLVQNVNDDDQPYDSVVIDGLRGVGSVVIPGSKKSFDLQLDFVILAADYTACMSAYNALDALIVPFTPYVLKIDQSTILTKNFNVKRIGALRINNTADGRRVKILKCSINFLANAW